VSYSEIEGKAAFVEAPLGMRSVGLFGLSTQHRGQTYLMFRLLLSASLN
jgi:hypothetical protein